MSVLKLRVIAGSIFQPAAEYGAVANIYPLPAGRGGQRSGRSGLRNLVVPTAMSSRDLETAYKEVELAPGRYRVEAALPSGELLQDEVTLLADAPPLELQLRIADEALQLPGGVHAAPAQPRDSGSEEKGLGEAEAQWLGGVGEAQAVAPVVSMPVVTTVSAPAARPAKSSPAGLTPAGELVARGLFFALPGTKRLAKDRSFAAVFSPTELDPAATIGDDLLPAFHTPQMLVYRFEDDCLRGEKHWDGRYRGEKFTRRYILLAGEGVVPQYSVLPLPWILPHWDRLAPVQALVYSEDPPGEAGAGFDQGYRLSVMVSDEVIGSLLGYLGSGELVAAGSILKQARERLWYKDVNPLAAAACAYVMIAAWEPGDADYWHQWVRNLMNWFPWLPDGAIQYAWVRMKADRSPQTLQEARAALLEGHRRGLPFFSKGVSLLLDGLTLFRNDALAGGSEDGEVEQALKAVRLMALRTNMRQVFTTVLLR